MPKIVDHEEQRAHIADAVTQIIIRDGFDHVTMRQIATEAGYAHGAISRYFPDKQSLLTAAFLQVFNASHERILTLVGPTRGLSALRIMSQQLLPFREKSAEVSRVVLSFWDRAAQVPEILEVHKRTITQRRGLIRRFLQEAAEDNELHPSVDVEEAINRVSVFNAGWQMLAVLTPEDSTGRHVTASIDAMIAGLGTERSNSSD